MLEKCDDYGDDQGDDHEGSVMIYVHTLKCLEMERGCYNMEMIMMTIVIMTWKMCADGSRIPPDHRVDDRVDDHVADDHDDICGHDHVENVC